MILRDCHFDSHKNMMVHSFKRYVFKGEGCYKIVDKGGIKCKRIHY
jgi:hypothetical protein